MIEAHTNKNLNFLFQFPETELKNEVGQYL